MRKHMLVVVVAVMLGVSGCVAIALAQSSHPADYESSLSADDAKIFYSKVAGFGMELKDAAGVPVVAEEVAITLAKKEVAGMIAEDAGRVTAMYASLSDYSANPDGAPQVLPGTTRIMKDVPVWIVTFHGVQMRRSGSCMIDATGHQVFSAENMYVFGDANVVVDAETGDVLEGFSYSTPFVVQH